MSKLADCRKFSPNVFNKNKCASCFKAKEEHSEEALENNRASRKVAKCGYLFAAPDWDFSNPINRTKRWQRRWFVLYDDGELTYSVDEHPETVPQAIIDMNRVVEVSEAEQVTGHPFSLALTAADRVHFLKGTSREESKWWFDILSMFPRTNMKTGRHKRNATFPGSKATTIIPSASTGQQQQQTAPNSPCLGKGVGMEPFATPPMSRPRFHSHTESLVRGTAASPASSSSFHLLPPVKDTNGRPPTATSNNNNGPATLAIDEDDTIPVKEAPAASSTPAVGQQASKIIGIDHKDFDDKLKKRVIRREIRGARSARCNSEILTSMILPPSGCSNMSTNTPPNNNNNNKSYALVLPSSTLTAPIGSGERPRSALLPPVHPSASPAPRSPAANPPHSPFYLYMADVPRSRHFESLDSLQHAFNSSRVRHGSSKDAPDSSGTPVQARTDGASKERPVSMHELGRSASSIATRSRTENPPGEAVRGDPDGCGLDPVTSFCSPLPDRRSTTRTSASVLVDDCIKKGWLLRLSGGEWKKYWFVLRSGTVAIFRDHASEDAGIADDVIDLTQMTSCDETDAGRSYGFQLVTSDKKHSLAALTSGIRSQWMQALRNACNQGKTVKMSASSVSSASSASSVSTLKAEKENVDPLEHDQESLESFETTSGDEDEDEEDDDVNGDSLDGDGDAVRESDASGPEVLPPSPPLNRNPMSRVKERDRSRSSSRSRSRHRSGSPASSIRTNSPPAPRVCTPVTLDHQQMAARSSSPLTIAPSGVNSAARLDAAKSEITRLLNERREHEREAKQQVANLTARLAEKEQQVNRLASQLEAVKLENQRQINDIRKLLESKETELNAFKEESVSFKTENSELRENLKRERSEVFKLRDVAAELRSLLESRNDTLSQLQSKTDEVEQLNRRLKATQENLSQTQERLQRGIDENEGLFARLRQMEETRAAGGPLRRSRSSTGSVPLQLQLCNRNLLGGSGSKKSLLRLDSLSDLSNIDYELDLDSLDREALVDEYVELRTRFERSLVEIRALKRELKQTQSALDGYEVAQVALKQQWQAKEADYTSQLSLMAARVQDLTAKMAAADKQVRQLKLKVAKSESREKRRTQSLKGRESFQLSKEVEDKLVDLEQKMAALSAGSEREGTPTRTKKGFEETTKSFRLRRKSLEGGAASGGDPVKILLRVDQLEQQLAGRQAASRKTPDRKLSPPSKTSAQGKPPRSSALKSPVKRSLDANDDAPACKSSKIVQDLEQCIVELELLFNNEKIGSESVVSKIRSIQQDLLNQDGSRSVCVTDGIEKIQELLRTRLSELKVKRDHERNVGRLDSAALSQIAAEKLALELAIAEQLAGVSSTDRPEERENLRDAHWTVQKLGWLKRKLNGEKSVPALEQSTCFGTYCAALAERLSAVAAVSSSIRAQTAAEGTEGPAGRTSLPPRVAQHLADEERELSQVFGRYKEEKIKELAMLLAHETLRMGDNSIPDNQLVEEVKVRQAWLEAQEIANKELVDSDIRQALTRMAEVFAEDVGVEERLASALLLWPVQQLQYEQRCQVVEEVLRSEMEEAVMLLSNAYERSLKELKAQGGAQPPEVDLEAAISEFAEMVAHKALVDGHIAVLQGENSTQPLAAMSGADSNIPGNIGVIQETEEIIGPMCNIDFFPNALHCGEVAAILHRNLVEPRKAEDAGSLKDDRSGSSSTVNEDLIRQKYQAEIEHLRALTEKGMSAMEGSHKRIIAQLEEKHQQEIARLQDEKERALAEETQATLAALDAMRKAHEAEVQREISRFKEEFLSQMARQKPAEPESPNRQHEMEEIRREILSLSEKYSHKCLESAALEQKVSSLSQQVTVFQRQITDLDARNQQLRAFLDAGPGSIPQDADPGQLLRAKDSQLIMLQEDIAELQFCLRESQSREEELASLARNLGQYLRTERPLSGEEIASLRHRLEDLLLLSGPAGGGQGQGPNSPTVAATGRKSLLFDDKTRDSPPRDSTSRFHYVRSKDLTRSPSCPRLSGFLSLAPRLSTRPVPLTPRDSAPGTNHH